MDLFDLPNEATWKKRRDWLDDKLCDSESGGHSLSDHAVSLFMDMQLAFCAGAWISVIIVSVSVIDSHLRETEAMNANVGTAKLLLEYFQGEDIDWLRRLRNLYVHHDIHKPLFGMNDWFDQQEQLERDAYKAMDMTISAIFQNPWV